jgi:hypothetical protein
VNDAYRIAPWADVCYFADSEWWHWHKDKPEFVAFAGEKCSIQNTGANVEDGAVHLLRNKNFPSHGTGLSTDPEYLVTGGNSGWQAINVAVLAGARTVILLGYDAREPVAWQKTHWFGEHPKVAPVAVFAEYRKSMRAGAAAVKAAGVRVVNCSPGSAIEAFERMDLAQALRL